MSLRDAAEAILKSVEGKMSSAYNRARDVCCGRGIYECCGSPEPEWDEADQLVMNTLAPIQNALRAALTESAGAEPVDSTGGTLVEQIAEAKRDMAQWPQWMQDAAHVSAAVAHPPARGAESVVNQQLTTELSDEEILEIWSPSLDGNVQRPILGKNKIIAFARAVLAARGKG